MSNMINAPAGRSPSWARALPELLCPVGSYDMLREAVAAGADAVYLGASSFNARINAENFSGNGLRDAVSFAHENGVRVYLALNTLVFDREASELLQVAREAAAAGVDAFIVADVGMASEIHKRLPNMPLHASTQMSGHCADMGKVLKNKGFTRFVIAREASLEDIKTATSDSGLEVEAFVHGALCVSHSGQCLFSSVVGGRSGNRGVCAQPCRLPYCRSDAKGKADDKYPLSLKDLSLAEHMTELIDIGVSSLKIEGRMKSPEYVRNVTAIWRRLLDERRDANAEEMRALADIFSRGGFTDGYFEGKINGKMMGVRAETDKQKSIDAQKISLPKHGYLPLDMKMIAKADGELVITAETALFRGEINGKKVSASVTLPKPETAQNRATTKDDIIKSLSKVGGTAYRPPRIEVTLDGGLIIPQSQLNAARRALLEKLDVLRLSAVDIECRERAEVVAENISADNEKTALTSPSLTARFYMPETVTRAAAEYFDIIYFPLNIYSEKRDICQAVVPSEKLGVIMPPVIFDRERDEAKNMLLKALGDGVKNVMIGNIGHFPLVHECGVSVGSDIKIVGDYRLNVANISSAKELLNMGMEGVTLSPELSLPRLRDISRKVPTTTVVYGRITLMTLEKCAIRELYGKDACDICGKSAAEMRDRRGMIFPILREWKHRNIMVNSLPTSMTDKASELDAHGLYSRHFIFTTETKREVDNVIDAAKKGSHVGGEVRRIVK